MPLLVGLMVLGMAGGMAFGLLFEHIWPVAPGIAGAIGGAAVPIPEKTPTLTEMIVNLIPTNLIAAAGEGALASIVIFATIFGFAVSRIDAVDGEPVIRLMRGLAEAMMRIVHWVLWFAPLGIFVLSLDLALGAGLAMAGFLAEAVILVCVIALLTMLLSYLLAWLGGGVSPVRFGRAIIGAQAMAAGTTSSAATLPLMIEASKGQLGISERIVDAVLPLTVSVFRLASVAYSGALMILFMRAVGIPLEPAKLAIGGALLVLGITSAGGLPGAAVIYASTIAAFRFLGLPLEFIPLMIAVSAFPDALVTAGNVTADLAATVTIARLAPANRRPSPL
jgi:Na+/H+-dicarboxylate symporter